MPRQVEGQYGKTHSKSPFDHMAIQANVVVIAMQQHQRGARLLRPPSLHSNLVTGGLQRTHAGVRRPGIAEAVKLPVGLFGR